MGGPCPASGPLKTEITEEQCEGRRSKLKMSLLSPSLSVLSAGFDISGDHSVPPSYLWFGHGQSRNNLDIFNAIAEPRRREIVNLLALGGERDVTELVFKLGLP
jgi:hypothetical protein